MRIEIEIPKEFEEHFEKDNFEDTLERLIHDAHLIAGNYEKETATMLIKAFKESKPAYDVEKVVAELEEIRMRYFLTIANTGSEKLDIAYGYVSDAIDKVIDLVGKGSRNELPKM